MIRAIWRELIRLRALEIERELIEEPRNTFHV